MQHERTEAIASVSAFAAAGVSNFEKGSKMTRTVTFLSTIVGMVLSILLLDTSSEAAYFYISGSGTALFLHWVLGSKIPD